MTFPNFNSVKKYTIEKDWDIKDFEYVEEIKFTGGEPMLHPNFIKTIDTILATGKQKNITLDIFTNASWVPKDKVIIGYAGSMGISNGLDIFIQAIKSMKSSLNRFILNACGCL